MTNKDKNIKNATRLPQPQIEKCDVNYFYNHYDSKEQLLFELIDERLEEEIRIPYEQFGLVR